VQQQAAISALESIQILRLARLLTEYNPSIAKTVCHVDCAIHRAASPCYS
jgi:hypothetical protein